ncbi:MAG TPA: serine hydrolase domain-containing protein [Burkholderiales bacterium]|nr:serine hydrolase domain-containing protein [Burkholderiales bacterium]
MLRRFHALLVLGLLALVPLISRGGPLPEANPADVGLSSERLQRLTAVMQAAVDSGEIPGAAVMIARKGKLVYQKAFGMQDKAKGTPMAIDSIFRIFSMTKPIVSVAALILIEEGKLGLHEPVSKYLPEFKEMKIAVEAFDPTTGAQSFYTVPAKRQITVQDLMRHTSGLTYGVFLPKTSQLGNLYREAKPFAAATLDEFSKTIAKLPLRYEPGTTWEYGHSTDILGRVVEVASGQPLDTFVAERILKPLKMNDTAWFIPPDKVARLAQPLAGREKDWLPELMLDFTKPTTFFAGGHGLVSTPGDYLRFAQMLANGGELEGVRLLGPRTIAYATSDHVLAAGIGKGGNYLPGPGYGFGLGFGVRKEPGASEWNGSVGDYFWGGYAGTYFWIDPKEELVPVYMMQEVARRNHYRILLRDLVYQAIVQ